MHPQPEKPQTPVPAALGPRIGYWGFVPESNIVGTPVLIYMSVRAPDDAWQPGQFRERFTAYLNAMLHPHLVRWNRLFKMF